ACSSPTSSSTNGDNLVGGGLSSNVTLSDSLTFIETDTKKDKNKAKNDKTKLEMEKIKKTKSFEAESQKLKPECKFLFFISILCIRTRSQSRNNLPQQEASPAIVEPLRIELPFLEDQFQEDPPEDPPEVSMADNRTMVELLKEPTEGYEDFFPPSKTTNLRNEITRFQQRFDESFYEAWDHFNDLLRACPHHGFSELHQLDTFYNALNVNDQDSLNSAAGGNFLDKMPRECLKIVKSKSKVRQSRAKAVVAKVSTSSSTPAISFEVSELKDMVRALLLDKKNQSSALAPSSTPAPVKAVKPNCVTCGGAHSYQNCPATSRNDYRDNIQEWLQIKFDLPVFLPFKIIKTISIGGTISIKTEVVNQPLAYQAPTYQAPIPQTQSVTQTNFESYIKANDAVLRNMQNQGQNMQNQCQGLQTQIANLTDMLSKLVSSNTASSLGSGTLPSNTITNPKEDLKGITTRSGVAYQGPTIPAPSKVVKQGTECFDAYLETFIPYPSRRDNERRRDQSSDQIEKFYEIFKDMSFEIRFTYALTLMPKFTSTLKALIGNKEKLSKMARTPMNEHCSAVILNKLPRKLGDPGKFLIPCEFPGMDECLALADLGASINLMPLFMWERLSLLELTPTCMTLKLVDRSVSKPIGITKDVSVKVGVFHFPAEFVVVDFEPDPRVPLILRRCFLKTGQALIDVHMGELTLRMRNEAITYNLDQMTANKMDVICEEYSQEVLSFSDVTASGNPTPYDDPIVSITSPTFTPFGDIDFLLFEEADAFLSLEDDPNSPKINPFYYDSKRDILLLEAILNSEPLPPLPNHEQYMPLFKKELKMCEAKTVKSSIDEPPEVELKDLPPHLEYAFLEGDDKLPVIIAKELGDEEKSALIKVLMSHKRAIAWKLSDIQGINLEFCTHKILMEEDYKPVVQHQRRVNPKIHDVIKKEVEKLLDAGLIYLISNSPWVSPVQCVPKKGGFTFVENEKNELIPTRLVTGWRVCIDYRKLNEATRKDHFPLSFMDQMLERLVGNEYYYFLDGFSGCMLAIFHEMVEKTMEDFMDDYSVFRNSFEKCLSRLDKMLQRSSSKLSRNQTSNPTSSTNPTPKGRIRRSSKQKVENSNFEEHLPPQKFDESFHEAWERYKDLLRACPHHSFTELHQLDNFYNALNPEDRDSLNAAAGGNLLEKSPQDALTIIENKSKVHNSRSKPIASPVNACYINSSSEIAKLRHAVNQQTSVMTTAMTVMLKQLQATCGGAHPYYQCLAAGGNTFPEFRNNIQGYVSAAACNYNQGNPGYRPQGVANQMRPPGFAQPNVQNNQNRFGQTQGFNRGTNFNQEQPYQATAQSNQNFHLNELEKIKRMNDVSMKAMQNEIDMVKTKLRNEMKTSIQTALSNQTNEIKNMMASLLQINTTSTSRSGSLPGNTVANPKGEFKAITTRSGLVTDGPTVPTPPKSVTPEDDECVE
nr:hypothetical protein [Tanacetum cinerariifolium]